MNGHPSDDLAAFALGVLDASERESVERHLAHCPGCQEEVAAPMRKSGGMRCASPSMLASTDLLSGGTGDYLSILRVVI